MNVVILVIVGLALFVGFAFFKAKKSFDDDRIVSNSLVDKPVNNGVVGVNSSSVVKSVFCDGCFEKDKKIRVLSIKNIDLLGEVNRLKMLLENKDIELKQKDRSRYSEVEDVIAKAITIVGANRRGKEGGGD